jgi:SAM-dependent methyltransferase
MRVLEVGCNVGFFSLEISELVGHLDAFDADPCYRPVSELVQTFCQLRNCKFLTASVHDFSPPDLGQYDCIISTAVHGWSKLRFDQYVSRITEWLRPGGLLLFESHELNAETQWPDKRGLLLRHFDLVDHGLIDDVDTQMYESELREFFLLRKRETEDYSRMTLPSSPTEAMSPQRRPIFDKEWICAAHDLMSAVRSLARAIARLARATLQASRRTIRTKCSKTSRLI